MAQELSREGLKRWKLFCASQFENLMGFNQALMIENSMKCDFKLLSLTTTTAMVANTDFSIIRELDEHKKELLNN